MSVVANQPQRATVDMVVVSNFQGKRNWSTDVFDCFEDCNGFFRNCCCFPCVLCNLATQMKEWCLMPFLTCGGIVAMRTKLRTMGNIRGTICGDCISSAFCGPCVVCQMNREMDHMGLTDEDRDGACNCC